MSSVNCLPVADAVGMVKKGIKKEGSRGVSARRFRERRQSERLPLAIPVFARGVDAQGKEFLEFTTTLNISAGGALLVMRRYLPIGSKVFLEIPAAPLPRLATPPPYIRSVETQITRVTPSDPSYLWAVRFDQRITPS